MKLEILLSLHKIASCLLGEKDFSHKTLLFSILTTRIEFLSLSVKTDFKSDFPHTCDSKYNNNFPLNLQSVEWSIIVDKSGWFLGLGLQYIDELHISL